MKEELLRIEGGIFQYDSVQYSFDLDISRGECIGFFADDHEYDGTAYEGIFSGSTVFKQGKIFAEGRRISAERMKQWIQQHVIRINRKRFTARELNVLDLILHLGADWSSDRLNEIKLRMGSEEARNLKEKMQLSFSGKEKLTDLSVTEYYKLAVYRAWLHGCDILILDRITEILPSQELDHFMSCIQILQSQGMGILMLEMNENFLYQYASRVDVVQNRKLCYRLLPEEYGTALFKILGWRKASGRTVQERSSMRNDSQLIIEAEQLVFEDSLPLDFSIRKGEIGLFRDEHLTLLPSLKECMLSEKEWSSGKLFLKGKSVSASELRSKLGGEIGFQPELPDRKDGILFDNLTGLENLTLCLIPKSGRKIIRRNTVTNVLHTAMDVFPEQLLHMPVKQWSHPDRLKLVYYRWYLMNPELLICIMPFSGQETALHEVIVEMLVKCAGRGMAVLLISSGVDSIYENTDNREFQRRLQIL